MSGGKDIAVPFIKSVTGACEDDGDAITLTVEAKDGQSLTVAVTAADLGKAISFLIDLAQHAAARTKAPVRKRGDMLSGTPVAITHIGVAPGRTDDEALLAVALGPVDLMFATEREMLAGICRDLAAHTAPRRGQKPH